jgi:hypothetical protein
MSQAVAIDIPSLIRLESQKNQPHCLTKRYQLPEHYCPSYLRHPNQPFSSPSSVSSSSSSSSLDQEERDGEESIFNESSSAISVDGEFDVRIDMIVPSPEKEVKMPTSASSNLIAAAGAAGVYASAPHASAPPLSDDDIENIEQQQQQQQQQQKEEEEVCVCVICYEIFEEPVELIHGRNYTSEELEDIEGKSKVTDFCQTCKYNVHHRCIDEYRLTKMTDILRSGYQRGYIQPPDVAGTFAMKCLMCAKEVEKIHITMNGDVNIVKTQPGANAQNQEHRQHQQQQPQQQQQMEEIMRNRMQRRLRRRQRFQFCKNKFCSICFMFLVAVTLLVLVFRMI